MRYNSINKQKLNLSEVEWVGYTFEDPNVRTFRYQNKYYKAVQSNAEKWARKVLKQEFLDHLSCSGLIPETKSSDIQIEGFGQIYAQHTENFNVPMTHWSSATLKEAGGVFLSLNKELLNRSMRCIDGHCYNYIIQGDNRPRWCDIGSFIPLKSLNENSDLDQFVRCIIYPLLLRQKDPCLDNFRRWTCPEGMEHEAAKVLFGIKILPNKPRDQMLCLLNEILKSISFSYKNTLWAKYHKDYLGNEDINDTNIAYGKYNRDQMVALLLKLLKPKTVVDLGANAGFFSHLAAQSGAEVLAIDPDEAAVDSHLAYLRQRNTGYNIKLMLGGVDGVPYQQADLALALALTHHLFLTSKYPWKLIAKCLAKHTSRSLLTEFMPHGLNGVNKPESLPSNYRIELFLRELDLLFEHIEVVDYPTPQTCAPRTLILCVNKRTVPLVDEKGNLP